MWRYLNVGIVMHCWWGGSKPLNYNIHSSIIANLCICVLYIFFLSLLPVGQWFCEKIKFHNLSPLTSLTKWSKFYALNVDYESNSDNFNHWKQWKPREKVVNDFQNHKTNEKQVPTVWMLYSLSISWELRCSVSMHKWPCLFTIERKEDSTMYSIVSIHLFLCILQQSIYHNL